MLTRAVSEEPAMKPLVISFVLLVAAVCAVFLSLQQYLLALAWLCFAAINAVALRKLYVAPGYFEKVIMDYLDRADGQATRDALLRHFTAETPNLKGDETEAVFSSTLARLERRGLVRVAAGVIDKHRR